MNDVKLFGNLGQDAKVVDFENGRSVIEFSLATTESWKDKDGNKQSATEWHDCKMFRKTGHTGVSEYLKKGASIIITDSMLKNNIREIGAEKTKVKVTYVDINKIELVNVPGTQATTEAAPEKA